MKTSCGIILKHGDKYLLGHATHRDQTSWTFFKGLLETNELPEEAAYREFKEETGIDLYGLGLKIAYHSSYYLKDKRVMVYLCDDETGKTLSLTPKCNSLVDGDFPEIDDFRWVTKEEALKLVYRSQKELWKKL
jgi:8-oxo-dGTP pyrophosphatase MutT (NUDIX family)